jgi:hypothetical protein
VDLVYEYLRNNLKITGKVGVFGRSLGGIPSSHLSSKVDLAVIDRTFGSLDAIAKYRFFSRISSFLFKVGSFGWQVQSDESYLKASNCYKVIM